MNKENNNLPKLANIMNTAPFSEATETPSSVTEEFFTPFVVGLLKLREETSSKI